jgi:hypothetical protein
MFGMKMHSSPAEFKIDSLVDLLEEQDEKMRKLFAQTLNLYVSPGADATLPKEKMDRLRLVIEESLA